MDKISAITRVTSASSYRHYNVVHLRWQIQVLQQKIDSEFNAKDQNSELRLSQVARWQKKIAGLERQIMEFNT